MIGDQGEIMSKKSEAMLNAYNQLKVLVYKLHPEHSEEYQECIVNAWDYLNDYISSEDFMSVLEDEELMDEYRQRFGDERPSEVPK